MMNTTALTRWTAYEGRIPIAHAETKEEALRLGMARGKPTRIVERSRAYPFRTVQTIPVTR